MPETKYRIVRLQSTNVKRIKAVTITPEGNVVTIGGRNDQGKTSVLDSIQMCLAGAGTICDKPLRTGADKGEVVVDLGDLIVTRTFSNKGTFLRITTKEGVAVASPQSILDTLAARISFDPLEFTRMKEDKQVETLRKLVGLNFSKIESDKKKLYDERTTVNRDLAYLEARMAAMVVYPDAPPEPVSVRVLMTELQELQKANKARQQKRDDLVETARKLDVHQAWIKTTQEELARVAVERQEKIDRINAESQKETERIQQSLNDHTAQVAEYRALIDAAPEIEPDADEAPINAKIESADEVNVKVRANAARAEAAAKAADLAAKTKTLTGEMEALDKEKQRMLAEATFPLPGLSFDDAGVLLDGEPFNQAGTARKILCSVAIARTLCPKLPVILIRDGSLLDEDSMKALCDAAKEFDLQVWIEVVTDKGVSVVLEDGEIKAQPKQPELAEVAL